MLCLIPSVLPQKVFEEASNDTLMKLSPTHTTKRIVCLSAP